MPATAATAIMGQVPLIVATGTVGLIASQVAQLSKAQRKRLVKKQPYYCRKCKRKHKYGTAIYREHVVYGR